MAQLRYGAGTQSIEMAMRAVRAGTNSAPAKRRVFARFDAAITSGALFAIAANQGVVMPSAILRGIVLGLVVLSIACGHSTPTAPTATPQAPGVTPVPAPQPQNLPPLTGSSRTFAFDHELAYSVHDYTKQSRFILYDTGGFALQFPSAGEYRGGYTEADGVITFQWEGWSTAGPWGATGMLKDGSLIVQVQPHHAAVRLRGCGIPSDAVVASPLQSGSRIERGIDFLGHECGSHD